MKVLFVCLGNICRSPLAEAIFKHKLRKSPLGIDVFADSCGTADYHIGELPDHRTRRNAIRNGVEINHRGRQLQPEDLERFDYILAMDKSNVQNIMQLENASLFQHKIHLLRSFDPDPGDEVPDPYYGGEEGFQSVFEMLDRSLDHFITKIDRELS